MLSTCSNDPVVCIDIVALFIGAFLKDWTTMAILLLLLVLLFKLKADKQRAKNLVYAMQMEAYDSKRTRDQTRISTWETEEGRLVERE